MMNKNRIIPLLLVAVLLMSLLPVTAQEDEIHISTADDLVRLAEKCTLDSFSIEKTVILDNDIDLYGSSFTCIPYFNGNFKGNGYTIQNYDPAQSGSHIGFFRYIGQEGSVSNLTLNGKVQPGGSAESVGGICGTNYGSITICSFVGSVKGSKEVGAIAGSNYGNIRTCTSGGSVNGRQYTGGICGMNSGTVSKCSNYAEINTVMTDTEIGLNNVNVPILGEFELISTNDTSTVSDTGGIAGASTGVISACNNYGVIGYQHYGYNVGGIAGRQSGYILDSRNYGKVHGKQDIGGIVGQMEPYMLLESARTLADELQLLNRMVNHALYDSNGETGNVADVLNAIQDDAGNAAGSAGTLAISVGTFIDNTVDTTNELLNRADYCVRALQPVTYYFNISAQEMNSGLHHLDTAMDNIELDEAAVDELSVYVGDLRESTRRMSDELTYMSYVVAVYYNKKGDGNINTDEMLPSQEEIDRIEAEYGYSFDIEDMSSAKLRKTMLQVGSDLITDTAKSTKARNNIIAILDDYYLTPIYDTDDDGVFETTRLDMARDEGAEAREDFIEASDYFSLATAGIEELNTYLAGLDTIQYSNLGADYYNATDALFYSLSSMTGKMTDLNNTVVDSSDLLTGDLEVINNQFTTVLTLLANAINGSASINLYDDVSELDTPDTTEGKVRACQNTGSIDGDTNVGGITGTMGIEYEFDMENKLAELTGIQGIFSNTYQTRCVVIECINRGVVECRKDNVGGIAGFENVGKIDSSESYGSVKSGDGSYVGGIVGYSNSTIVSSYAMCRLEGESYIGGVVGYGTSVKDCIALVGTDRTKECVGAVAGYADVAGGEILGNRYVDSGTGAIDGISYDGVAVPISYEELTSEIGIPYDFGNLKLSFTADGALVKEISFNYGGSVDKSLIPEVPEKSGFSGQWEDFDYSDLLFSAEIHAVYVPNQGALASELTREESPLPLVLVEGSFSTDKKVLLNEYSGTGPQLEANQQELEKWVLRIDDSYNEDDSDYSIRYLCPEIGKKAYVEIYKLSETGEWTKVSTRQSGSYTVFEGNGTTVFTAVETQKQNHMVYYAAGCGVAVVLIAVVAIAVKKSGKKKGKHVAAENDGGADV